MANNVIPNTSVTKQSSSTTNQQLNNSVAVAEVDNGSLTADAAKAGFAGAAPPPPVERAIAMIQRMPNSSARQQVFNQMRRTYGNKYCASIAGQLKQPAIAG